MIKITKRGFKGSGIYIGRPSPFGNPYPVKPSRHSNQIYTLEQSLTLYRQHFEANLLHSNNFHDLLQRYKEQGYLELDCYCINREVSNYREIDINNCQCHGEIIAFYLLRSIQGGIQP